MSDKNQASRTDQRKKRIYMALTQRQDDLTIILDNIHDPHNVSAIYRSCDAFGVGKAHLLYDNCAFPELGKKTSASARKWVASQRHKDAESMLANLRKEKFQILATSFSARARPLRDWNFLQPTAVILGNEHAGVRQELLEKADGLLYIPMHGLIQSFNVSVAAALIMGEAARQREDAGWYDQWRFSEKDLLEKYREWLKK